MSNKTQCLIGRKQESFKWAFWRATSINNDISSCVRSCAFLLATDQHWNLETRAKVGSRAFSLGTSAVHTSYDVFEHTLLRCAHKRPIKYSTVPPTINTVHRTRHKTRLFAQQERNDLRNLARIRSAPNRQLRGTTIIGLTGILASQRLL